MGIRLLNKFLQTKCSKRSITKKYLSEYKGKKIAIDVYNYLYRFKGDEKFIENLFVMCSIFRRYDISPIFVYDGKPPEMKREELDSRRAEKKALRQQYSALSTSPTTYQTNLELIKMKRSCSMITKNDVEISKKLIKNYGMSIIQSNGESDPLCVELVKTNRAFACLSDDMDMFAYGCPKVLRYLSLINESVIEYNHENILLDLHMNDEEFQILCILAGTDYGKFEKNIFIWYEHYIEYKKTNAFTEKFIEYLVNIGLIDNATLEKINSIRKMYIIRDTLKDYPFQSFNLHKIYYAGLQEILKTDNFIFHPMIACM